MADRLAVTRLHETKTSWLKGRDRRGWGIQRGKEMEVLNGVPRLPSAKDSLPVIRALSTRGLPRHIPEYWLHLSLSSCPHSTSPPPPPFSQPRQWIKEAVYAEQKNWAVPRRRETLPGDSCQQQQQWDALCVQSIRKQSRKQSVFLSALQTICR